MAYTGALSFTTYARNAEVGTGVMVRNCIQSTPAATSYVVEVVCSAIDSSPLLAQQIHEEAGDKLWGTTIYPNL